jgi:hypothetical protein
MSAPFPGSYWVEPMRLAAGEHPGTPRDLAALIAAGIGGLIDLTAETGLGGYRAEAARLAAAAGRDALHRRFPIADFAVPEIATMRAILDAIDEWRAAQRPVYVHCHAGIGRTGTVIGCWLVRHGTAPTAVLAELARRRSGTRSAHLRSPETAAQREFVTAWRKAW